MEKVERAGETPKMRVNLELIIDSYALDKAKLAARLYPDNAHPLRALNRLIKEELPLDEVQLNALASLMRVSIAVLFTPAN